MKLTNSFSSYSLFWLFFIYPYLFKCVQDEEFQFYPFEYFDETGLTLKDEYRKPPKAFEKDVASPQSIAVPPPSFKDDLFVTEASVLKAYDVTGQIHSELDEYLQKFEMTTTEEGIKSMSVSLGRILELGSLKTNPRACVLPSSLQVLIGFLENLGVRNPKGAHMIISLYKKVKKDSQNAGCIEEIFPLIQTLIFISRGVKQILDGEKDQKELKAEGLESTKSSDKSTTHDLNLETLELYLVSDPFFGKSDSTKALPILKDLFTTVEAFEPHLHKNYSKILQELLLASKSTHTSMNQKLRHLQTALNSAIRQLTAHFSSIKYAPDTRVPIRLNPEQLSSQDFEDVMKLGDGLSSKVFLTKFKGNGKQYAKKVITLTSYHMTNLMNEIEIQSRLFHPHIARLLCYFQEKDEFTLIIEYVPGTELFNHLLALKTGLPLKQVQGTMLQVMDALSYIHELKIILRDLKAENIILQKDRTIKIIDFGFAIYALNEETGYCGTALYVSPEMDALQPYTTRTDIYSLGILLFIITYGTLPFDPRNPAQMKIDKLEKRIRFTRNRTQEEYIITDDLIRKLCEPDPNNRITLEKALEHLFFKLSLPDGDPFKE